MFELVAYDLPLSASPMLWAERMLRPLSESMQGRDRMVTEVVVLTRQ